MLLVMLVLSPHFEHTWNLLEEVERLRDSVMREMQLGFFDMWTNPEPGTPWYHGDDSFMHLQHFTRTCLKKMFLCEGSTDSGKPSLSHPTKLKMIWPLSHPHHCIFPLSYLTLIPHVTGHCRTSLNLTSHVLTSSCLTSHNLTPRYLTLHHRTSHGFTQHYLPHFTVCIASQTIFCPRLDSVTSHYLIRRYIQEEVEQRRKCSENTQLREEGTIEKSLREEVAQEKRYLK